MFLRSNIVLFINKASHAELKDGEPALFLEAAEKVILFEEPTRFLGECYVESASTASMHTWAKAAYGLKSWFQYLQAIDREWLNASEQDRIDYRDVYLSAISQKTGRAYGASGIRDSMVVVRAFYEHCAARNLYLGDIGAVTAIRPNMVPIDSNALAHIRSAIFTSRDRALPKIRPGSKIHPLTMTDLKSLLCRVGPQAAVREGDKRPARDRLICDLGWAVGLRISEINSLTTLQFLGLAPGLDAPFVGIALTILHGKGGKTRQVMIPAWLVADVLMYIEDERAASLIERKSKSKYPTTRLLLAHKGSKSAGMPVTNGALQKVFREACLALGLVHVVEKTDPETGQKFHYKMPRHSIHDLRHTYAVLTYHAQRANGNAEPWKKIQAQLGHSNLQTTIETYLSHVEIFSNQSGLLDVRRMLGI
jgi:integrase